MRNWTVLLVGATGRTGQRTLRQLLERGVRVRAVVRSRGRLPADLVGRAGLEIVEASLLDLDDEALRRRVKGCDAIVSCLGHVLSFRGVFGPPRDLVTRATARLCRAVEALRPAAPVRFVLLSSVSVHRARALDPRRGPLERAFLRVLRDLVPPARDNQRAADFLLETYRSGNGLVEWVVVRPDSLREGDVAGYALHEGLVNGIFSPGTSRMASVAHLLCELAIDPAAWAAWRFKFPVVVDAAQAVPPPAPPP